ncbi:MAG: hypothetical protein L3J69_07150 [Desulfobacula sp.]|nr:hypothetical protein [Desulfobacula sp.]
MNDIKPLTTKVSTNIFIAVNLLFIVPITLFFAPFFLSLIIALFGTEPIDSSRVGGLLTVSLIILAVPIYMTSIVCRMKQISISNFGFHFCGKTVYWKEIEKITFFTGNSRQFTIKYTKDNQQKKVFGSLFFERKKIIQNLKYIAEKHSIPISKWWL